MKLLYGTGNLAKLSVMKSRIETLNHKFAADGEGQIKKIEVIGLKDLNTEIPQVPEDGATPLENARQKAIAYYEAFHIPVFSCDSGLYFDNVPEEVQPGVHVRNVNGRRLTDEEMRAYYAGLAERYGDLTARYRNAICFVYDEERQFEAMDASMESEPFLLTSRPHSSIRREGFPLDSLSIDIRTGKYYYDLAEQELEQVTVEDGFLQFFERVLKCID